MWVVPLAHAEDADIPVLVAPADLRLRKSDSPRFPADPTSPAARCLVRVVVDQAGVPADLDTRACSPTYAALAEDSVRHWRWDPPRGPLGEPAEAMVLIPITFTPPGRAPITAAERCTYTLDVATTGTVRVTGPSAPQCVVWAPASTDRPPDVRACGVAVRVDEARDISGWVDVAACPLAGQAFAVTLLSQILFSTGTVSTRLMFTFPDPTAAPPPLVIDMAQPRIDIPTRLTRDAGNAGNAPAALDPPMVMTETELPEVDLSALLDPAKLPSKDHDPQPAPDPE